MNFIKARWRDALLILALLYIAADVAGLFDRQAIQGFGVTIGDTVEAKTCAVKEKQNGLFGDSKICTANFEPSDPTFLSDWDEFILHAWVETGEIFSIAAHKEYSAKEECLRDFELVNGLLQDTYGDSGDLATDPTPGIEVLKRTSFSSAGAVLQCSDSSGLQPLDNSEPQPWVFLSLMFS